jgi:hypothetical protein
VHERAEVHAARADLDAAHLQWAVGAVSEGGSLR